MASARKCDRCGNLYEIYDGIRFERGGYSYNWMRILTNHGSAMRDFDLCPECMTKLIEFLRNEEAKDE